MRSMQESPNLRSAGSYLGRLHPDAFAQIDIEHAGPFRQIGLRLRAIASPALMRAFCENIKRQIVVGPKADWSMDREAVICRVVQTVQPHPERGKPRLWSHGADDKALMQFPWPLKRCLSDYPGAAATVDAREDGAEIVPLKRPG